MCAQDREKDDKRSGRGEGVAKKCDSKSLVHKPLKVTNAI